MAFEVYLIGCGKISQQTDNYESLFKVEVMETQTKSRHYPLFVMGFIIILTGSCETQNSWQGRWKGNSVSFDVEGITVTSFMATFSFDFGSVTCEVAPHAKIINGSFSFYFDKDGIKTQVIGEFVSDTELSGKFGTINYTVNTGGAILTGTEDGYSWSATQR